MKTGKSRISIVLALAALVVATALVTTLVNQVFFAPTADPIQPQVPAAEAPAPAPAPQSAAIPDDAAKGSTAPEGQPTRSDPGETREDAVDAPHADDHAHGEAESPAPDPAPESAADTPDSASLAADDGPAPESAEPAPTMCVVSEGDPEKLFWWFVENNAEQTALFIGVELDYFGNPDAAARARAIEACVDNGAAMILATLADADAIVPALRLAAERGVRIATFGAGASSADQAGSLIHVSIDELAAGRRAAEQFNSAGISGPVICVIHPGASQTRAEVCNAVGSDYRGGEVITRRLTTDEPSEQIANLLLESTAPAGMLLLEADLLPYATYAMRATSVQPVLGSIGQFPLSQLAFEDRDLIAFTVTELARFQVLLTAAALQYMHIFHPNTRFFEGAAIFAGVPSVHTGGATGGHDRPGAGSGKGSGQTGAEHPHNPGEGHGEHEH